jgi:hypothetical protein
MSEASDKAYYRWLAAEHAWIKQIKSTLRGRPGDLRYTKAGKGEPGSPLRAAYDEWEVARKEYQQIQNVIGPCSNSTPFRNSLPLPRSRRVRRAISRLAANYNREWYNGCQPISGLFTLVGKAEGLPRGHKFRSRVAASIRRRLNERR